MRVCVCVCVCVCARACVMIKAVRWVRGKGLGGCGEGRAGMGCSQEERRPPSRLPPPPPHSLPRLRPGLLGGSPSCPGPWLLS